MIHHESSYVRTRGLGLICAQARWDIDGKLEGNIDKILTMLHDKKPTAVRQCLKALHEVVLYREELSGRILAELGKIDLMYKDTMAPLIEKDVAELKKIIME